MSDIDLQKYTKKEIQILSFARKSDAINAAKMRGWRVADVKGASNRFCAFWVIGQNIGTSPVGLPVWRFLTQNATIELEAGFL